VQKSNDQVHVNVQLLNAPSDTHLWANTYDRKLTDVFAVESEIAKKITDTLRAKLTGREGEAISARPVVDNEAHELYLKGRFFWNKRDASNIRRALAFFEESAKKDPGYALAYAGIADALVLLPFYGGADPRDNFPKAKEAANKALTLNPNLADPHATLGLIATVFDYDVASSRREFETAISLNPNYATAHHWYGNALLPCIGEADQSIAEIQRALELDPLSIIMRVDLGIEYGYAGRYQEGIAQVHKALDLDPDFYYAHYNLGEILEVSGDLKGAIAEYKKAVSLDNDPYPLALVGHAEAAAGNRERALQILQTLKETAAHRFVSHYSFAMVYLGLGETDQAMEYLEKSYAERQTELNTIRFDPLLKPLHGNPRFERLAEKILPMRELEAQRKK